MIDVWDANTRVLIAFFLALITGLLVYVAFFKEPIKNKTSKTSARK